MLPVTLSCSVSFSECGSIEIASPWSAKRSTAAPAPVATSSPAMSAAAAARFIAIILSSKESLDTVHFAGSGIARSASAAR